MRTAFILPFALACGLALPCLAQPAADQSPPAAPAAAAGPKAADAVQVQSKDHRQDADAAAALAITIRDREIQEQRIARIACAAGDTAKCQLVKADTTSRTSSP